MSESLGVDLVINSHVHNYQRTRPLKFAPKMNEAGDRYIVSPEGRVDGKFTLDENFDGVTNTKANRIIYLVSGAGGAALYDPPLSNKPELWKHEPADNWVPFTVKLISDIHSFTLVETNGKTLTFKQIDLTTTQYNFLRTLANDTLADAAVNNLTVTERQTNCSAPEATSPGWCSG